MTCSVSARIKKTIKPHHLRNIHFYWKTVGKWYWKVAIFFFFFSVFHRKWSSHNTENQILLGLEPWIGTSSLFWICKASSSVESCSTHRSPCCNGDIWMPLPAMLSSTSVVLLWKVQLIGPLLFESNCVFNRLTLENSDCY